MLGTGIQKRKIRGYDAVIDGKDATILASVPESFGERVVYKNPADFLDEERVLPSVSLIRSGKVKGFIDGVYAAVEEYIAVEGHAHSRPDLLYSLKKRINHEVARNYIDAAIAMIDDSVDGDAAKIARESEDVSLVHGFYDRTPTLRKAFKQIKVLQSPPSRFTEKEDEKIDKEAMKAMRDAMKENKELYEQYKNISDIYAKMSNKTMSVDALFPPAVLPDQEFLLKLSDETQSDITEGLAKAVIKAMKGGELDYTPKDDSGLYIWQMYEVQALAKRNTPEFEKYIPDEEYEKVLDGEAEGQFIATRDTHIAHTDYRRILLGASLTERPIEITPELYVEPLVEIYNRMERSLQFLEKSIASTIGDEFLDTKRILHTGKRAKKTMREEFTDMKTLLRGLSTLSKESIHMTYEPEDSAEEDIKYAKKWLSEIEEDVDINRDMSAFVPLMRETSGDRWIAHVIGGFELVPLEVEYGEKPIADVDSIVRKKFAEAGYYLPILVHKEVRIPTGKLINTAQLRKIFPEDEFTYEEFEDRLKKLNRCK
ncbi:MAG: hypothetical protein J7L08_02855 [Candidatus Aenigmarchaeota archaeon]|nr:hypothetical protein [Candidatus Aenigmarchaeota archaeon]